MTCWLSICSLAVMQNGKTGKTTLKTCCCISLNEWRLFMYSATPQSVMSQQVFCDGKECKFVSVVEIVASL